MSHDHITVHTLLEADLQAWVDGALPLERRLEVESYLAARPEEAARLAAYREHKRELRALFDPVLDEPLPQRLARAARPPLRRRWLRAAAVAGLVLAGGVAGYGLRAGEGLWAPTLASRGAAPVTTLAQRAAVAHAVYSPDQRRPVEVSAEHEDQLVAWLSKRMGAPMRAPHLGPLGYELLGGRLLPGEARPVAQFMYADAAGRKLTLYVSNELPAAGAAGAARNAESAFRYARQGAVNTFYWVDGGFGYALAAEAERGELARVAAEVYRQLGPR